MTAVFRLVLLAILFAFSCGGGGRSSSNSYSVSGQFLASYVKGLKVCISGTNECSFTDNRGEFHLVSDILNPELTFSVSELKIGSYKLKYNGEIVTPFKLAGGDIKTGEIVGKVIHAIGGDINGTAEVVDLTDVYAEPEEEIGNLVDTVRSNKVINIEITGGTVKIDPSNGTVEVCSGGSCKEVNYRQWLILIYMNGDNSLDSYIDKDIEEINSAAIPPTVKIVAFVDRKGNSGGEVWETDSSGKLLKVKTTEEPNMGNPETLESFLKEYLEKYPSAYTALIFWNHGTGWRVSRSSSVDEYPEDRLFMYETKEALQNVGHKFDVIGFDECLMGMVEVFYDLLNHYDYIAGSEYYEPGDGWRYDILLSKFKDNPIPSPKTFATWIVDAYGEAYKDSSSPATMIAMSENETKELVSAINTLSRQLNNDTFDDFYQARNSTETVTDDSYNYVDLYTLAEKLSSYSGAEEILQVIENSHKVTLNTSNLKGISIYYPKTKDDAGDELNCYLMASPGSCAGESDYYNPFASTEWDDFLKTFYQLEER